MKYFLLLVLILSCSKSNNSGTSTDLANGDYFIMNEIDDVSYSSQEIHFIQINEGFLTYSIGVKADYERDKDGNIRTGNHPNAEYKKISAFYEISKSEEGYQLKFLGSSCKDSNKNPFETTLGYSIKKISINNEKLDMQLNDNVSSFYKDNDGMYSKLEENKINVLCDGEVL